MAEYLDPAQYATLGWRSAADVLFALPDRVDGYRPVSGIAGMIIGSKVVITAQVTGYAVLPGTVAVITHTEGGTIGVVFEHRGSLAVPQHIRDRMPEGAVLTVSGVVVACPAGFGLGDRAVQAKAVTADGRYEAPDVRFYSRKGVNGGIIRATVQSAKASWPVPDCIALPGFPTLKDAVKSSTYAVRDEFLGTPSGIVMAIAELVAVRLMLAKARTQHQRNPAPVIPPNSDLQRRFLESVCPFRLTAAQRRAVDTLRFDSATAPSYLIEGDVGSGKTLVAFTAMLDVITTGHHAVLAVPMGTLAQQHYDEISRYCAALDIPCALLTAATTKSAREKISGMMKAQPTVLIGTHAVLDMPVETIGLLVIDEQHLFGVEQRERLLKSCAPHRPHLVMLTATAQPRSLAQLFAGDVRRALLDEKPPGRKPVITKTVVGETTDVMAERVEAYIKDTGQSVYWVLPAVDENEVGLPHVTERFEDLQALLPDISIGAVHGAMSDRAMQAAFRKFREGETKLLVASSVVQVGLSVAHANLMIVERADRFGVAQLHQLRGRVGRGSVQGACWLMTDKAHARAELLAREHDGFVLAREDAFRRGSGNPLGHEQHGGGDFRIFDPEIHEDVLSHVNTVMRALTPEQADDLLRFFGYGDWVKVRASA